MRPLLIVLGLFALLSLASAWVLPDKLLPYIEELAETAKDNHDDGLTRHKRTTSKETTVADFMMSMVRTIFTEADGNKDDRLDILEFWHTFGRFDSDGDDVITRREYLDYFSAGEMDVLNNLPADVRVEVIASLIFFAGDMNGDRSLSVVDANIIFGNLDADGDTFVSMKEYETRWGMVIRRLVAMMIDTSAK